MTIIRPVKPRCMPPCDYQSWGNWSQPSMHQQRKQIGQPCCTYTAPTWTHQNKTQNIHKLHWQRTVSSVLSTHRLLDLFQCFALLRFGSWSRSVSLTGFTSGEFVLLTCPGKKGRGWVHQWQMFQITGDTCGYSISKKQCMQFKSIQRFWLRLSSCNLKCMRHSANEQLILAVAKKQVTFGRLSFETWLLHSLLAFASHVRVRRHFDKERLWLPYGCFQK